MNKTVLAMLLVAASTAFAQTAAPAQTAPTTAPAPKKEMKDPAEYNAYMGAEQQTDEAAKISGFEAFVKQFPNSSYKEDALELLMIAYQKTNNQPKMIETAQRILQVEPVQPPGLGLARILQASRSDAARPPHRILPRPARPVKKACSVCRQRPSPRACRQRTGKS